MKKILLFVILNSAFYILNSFCFAQNKNIDSLLILLKTDKLDTVKVNHLLQLIRECEMTGSFENGLNYGREALELSLKLNFKKGIAKADNSIGNIYLNQGKYFEALKKYSASLKISEEIGNKKGIASSLGNIGLIYQSQGNYPEALKNYYAALKIRKEMNDKQGIAAAYNNIGVTYDAQGNYPDALKNYFASLKINEDARDKQGIGTSYNNIGIIYEHQSNYPEALKNYFSALTLRKELGNKRGIASSYNNIGNIYNYQNNYAEALKNYFASIKIKKEMGDKQGIADSFHNIGNIYGLQGNYQEALKNYLASLKIRVEIGDKNGIAASYFNIGGVQIKLKKYKEAHEYLNEALALSIEIGSKESIKEIYYALAELDSIQNNWKDAYRNHKQFIVYRDGIDNEETKKKTIQSQMTFDFDKKELATKAEQDKKDAISEAESKKQKIIRNTFISGFVLMLFLGIIIVRENHLKRKVNNHLKEKNMVIAAQKLVVEAKNKDISDSVAYAKRIQSSFLTSEAYIKKHLPEYFILYKPRDIVSGDFYWVHQQSDYLYFCVADCTGHGIPGAFMSLIGMGILNEIIYSKQIKDTNEILDELRRIVILALNPEGSLIEGKDGMDLILGRHHLQTKELQYSAANNSFYVFRKDELMKYKSDKMPVGKFGDFEKPFTQHTIQLETGDIIYASTDGFFDQFGGDIEKKFMSKRFEKCILSVNNKSLKDQKDLLEKEFMKWKGNREQVDDVCVFGVKI